MEKKQVAAKLGILLFLIGILAFCYPFLSRLRYAKKQEILIQQYQEAQKEVQEEKEVEDETQPVLELKDTQCFLDSSHWRIPSHLCQHRGSRPSKGRRSTGGKRRARLRNRQSQRALRSCRLCEGSTVFKTP